MNYNTAVTFTEKKFTLTNHLPSIGIKTVREEIIDGLKSTPKYISSKFFYDDAGSRLFEAITKLSEYYPTRTEKKILSSLVEKLNLDFNNLNIIELGSGDHGKISLFLKQIPEKSLQSICYYPVDISQSAIELSYKNLSQNFPGLEVKGIVADFIQQIDIIPAMNNRLFCFFGSTLGNFDHTGIREFITKFGQTLKPGDKFLLGLDMVKDYSILEKAYNDAKGVTAQFNLNALNVVKNLTGIDLNPANFEHRAFFNDEYKRIEMHLVANKDLTIDLPDNEKITLKKGETIHTENSHKFDRGFIYKIAEWADLKVKNIFTDEKNWFSLVHFEKT